MTIRMTSRALAAAAMLACLPRVAAAFPTCPANAPMDGYTCDQQTGAGKAGGFFRVTFPSDWDGDLVIINHGFDLNDQHTRPHESCSDNAAQHCSQDSDCSMGNFCNNISYLGLDEILLPMGKAVAASTYHYSGWAVFGSNKDIKDVIKFVKKSDHGKDLKRVIITGFSGGGAVTGDAILKMKIDGAVPLCAAVGGGLPTWDVAQDVRLVYDFLCDDAPAVDPVPVSPRFNSQPDRGEPNTTNHSADDAQNVGIKVNNCFGNVGLIGPSSDPMLAAAQAQRLQDFIDLTNFTGAAKLPGGGANVPGSDDLNVAAAMGFATLGLGDFVQDQSRMKGQRIGFNTGPDLDYSTLGVNPTLAATFDTDVERLPYQKGRKILDKYSHPDFTKGKAAKVAYPILQMSGANDWLVIPEFQRVFNTALEASSKAHTQTWINTFGHCVFTAEETTAVFNKFFEWLGPVGGPYGPQPTAAEVHQECIDIGGVDGDTCNFNDTFVPGYLYNRIPERSDWPTAAKHP